MTSRPALLQQDAQDLELARRQVDALAGDADLVPRGIELERSDDDPAGPVGGRAGRMSERDPEPRIELVDAERLGDVVVGAALERLDLLALLVAAGQDDDRRRGVSRGSAG